MSCPRFLFVTILALANLYLQPVYAEEDTNVDSSDVISSYYEDESDSDGGYPACCPHIPRNQFYIGPEIYYVRRNKEGGTWQGGGVYGVRAGYDRLKRYGWYIGGDVLYATGILHGHNSAKDRLRSRFTDRFVEGRFGYTFRQKCGFRFSFTPFAGIGYADETNNFVHPSPLPVHFKTTFSYGVAGFLSQMSYSPNLDVGFNFKARFLYDARSKVTHDPEFDTFEMLIKNRMHYRAEFPITYHGPCNWWVSLVPFYEYRQYGKQANYPFDFLETRLNLYGVTFKLMYLL